jgi:hypothetical protein
MAEFILFATVGILFLVLLDVAALMYGADSRIDAHDPNAGRVGIA